MYNDHMNKIGLAIVFILVIAMLTAGIMYFVNSGGPNGAILPSGSTGSSSGGTPILVLGAPSSTAPAGDQSVSDGTITITYPTSEFGLATTQQQILVRSYIPPCDANLTYCLYYIGNAYQGTNFDSAGIRIEKRTDLATVNACLTAPPSGFANFTPTSTAASDYSVSEFSPIGNAGAGHFSKGTLYRLAYNGTCYEFETRIGQSQFANYPSGTIQQFTDADQASLAAEIQNILDGITLPSGETVVFPN